MAHPGEPRVRKTITALLLILLAVAPAAADETAWALLAQGGQTVLIRHARAPGTGDPRGFALDDCATQRNLSEEGRTQARLIGARFAERGIDLARVLSSRWCRSLETARLAFGAERVEPHEPLDSFFGDRSDEPARSAAARRAIAAFAGPGVLVMVTHQVNITALTGIVPREGEAIVVTADADSVRTLGRIRFD